jgi:hypothetical protein
MAVAVFQRAAMLNEDLRALRLRAPSGVEVLLQPDASIWTTFSSAPFVQGWTMAHARPRLGNGSALVALDSIMTVALLTL